MAGSLAGGEAGEGFAGTQFTCFTSTEVQIVTQKTLCAAAQTGVAQMRASAVRLQFSSRKPTT